MMDIIQFLIAPTLGLLSVRPKPTTGVRYYGNGPLNRHGETICLGAYSDNDRALSGLTRQKAKHHDSGMRHRHFLKLTGDMVIC